MLLYLVNFTLLVNGDWCPNGYTKSNVTNCDDGLKANFDLCKICLFVTS